MSPKYKTPRYVNPSAAKPSNVGRTTVSRICFFSSAETMLSVNTRPFLHIGALVIQGALVIARHQRNSVRRRQERLERASLQQRLWSRHVLPPSLSVRFSMTLSMKALAYSRDPANGERLRRCTSRRPSRTTGHSTDSRARYGFATDSQMAYIRAVGDADGDRGTAWRAPCFPRAERIAAMGRLGARSSSARNSSARYRAPVACSGPTTVRSATPDARSQFRQSRDVRRVGGERIQGIQRDAGVPRSAPDFLDRRAATQTPRRVRARRKSATARPREFSSRLPR